MNTMINKNWYSRTNDKSINSYEWIQIIDQLQPSLKVRQGKVRDDLRRRLAQVKAVLYDLSKNNFKMSTLETKRGLYLNAEQFHHQVIQLYQEMMNHQ